MLVMSFGAKAPTSRAATTLVTLYFENNKCQKGGTGFKEGFYDITSNFTLIIESVRTEDDDFFFCEIFDLTDETPVLNQDKSTSLR